MNRLEQADRCQVAIALRRYDNRLPMQPLDRRGDGRGSPVRRQYMRHRHIRIGQTAASDGRNPYRPIGNAKLAECLVGKLQYIAVPTTGAKVRLLWGLGLAICR